MDALTPPLQNHLREFAVNVRGLLEVDAEPTGSKLPAVRLPETRTRRVFCAAGRRTMIRGLAAPRIGTRTGPARRTTPSVSVFAWTFNHFPFSL
jgi:hypothetical protein